MGRPVCLPIHSRSSLTIKRCSSLTTLAAREIYCSPVVGERDGTSEGVKPYGTDRCARPYILAPR